MKRLVGQQDGLQSVRMTTRKEEGEKALRAAVAGRPELQKAYGSAWDEIAAGYRELPAYAKRTAFFHADLFTAGPDRPSNSSLIRKKSGNQTILGTTSFAIRNLKG